jgi:CubicO group peptidase (beta-lactamase class C family)
LGAEVVEPQKFTADTVCWMASCTKLMATVAAMQCVERGLLDLDADITDLLPELKDIDILLKFVDDGSGGKKPLLKKAKGKITLRYVAVDIS